MKLNLDSGSIINQPKHMKKSALLLAAMSITLIGTGNTSASFQDVPSTSPYYDAINFVQEKGIVTGYPDQTFKENNEINRGEFAKIIVEAVFTDEEIKACNTSVFKDVPTDAWFTPYVCVAEKNDVIDGYPDKTFQAAKTINLVEATKIIANAFDYQTEPNAIWYKPYIDKLDELNALPVSLKGFDDKVTRGLMTEMVYRIMAKITDKSSTTYDNLEKGIMAKEFTNEEIKTMATDHNDKLVDAENEALNGYDAYVALTDNGNLDGDFVMLEKERIRTTEAIKKIQTLIAIMSGFQGDVTLRDGFVKDLQDLIDVLNNEEKKLIELWVKMAPNPDNIPANLIDEENALYDSINDKSTKAYDALSLIQEAFADKYGFKLEVAQDTEALAYKNSLIAFQSEAADLREGYIDQTDLTDLGGDFNALNLKRLDTVTQIKALKEEMLTTLGYKGDVALRDAFVDNVDSMLNTLENEEKDLITVWMEMSKDPNNIPQSLSTQEDELLASIDEKDTLAQEKLDAAEMMFDEKYYNDSNLLEPLNHTFYTSTHYTSKLYYCDTDLEWKSLSANYLKSYSSESALLVDYPNKTLHEACK